MKCKRTDGLHTPTPWKLRGQGDIEGRNIRGNALIATTWSGEPYRINTNEMIANAEFIVRAVNELEALKAENDRLLNVHEVLVKLLTEQLTDYEILDAHRITAADKAWIERTRQAIAEVKGK